MSKQFVLQNRTTGRYLVKVGREKAVTSMDIKDARVYPSAGYAETCAGLIPKTNAHHWAVVPKREGVL